MLQRSFIRRNSFDEGCIQGRPQPEETTGKKGRPPGILQFSGKFFPGGRYGKSQGVVPQKEAGLFGKGARFGLQPPQGLCWWAYPAAAKAFRQRPWQMSGTWRFAAGLSKIFNKYLGASGKPARQGWVAESVSPCILWIDGKGIRRHEPEQRQRPGAKDIRHLPGLAGENGAGFRRCHRE